MKYGGTRFISRSNTRHRRIFHSLVYQRIQCYALGMWREVGYLLSMYFPQQEPGRKNAICESGEHGMQMK